MTNNWVIERAADAALFEDWSEWESLDDLPATDKRFGYYNQSPTKHTRYWCALRRRSTLIGGPAFELFLPEQYSIQRMVDAIPGVRRLPGRFPGSNGIYLVPAQHWQTLREVLPALKEAVSQYARKKR